MERGDRRGLVDWPPPPLPPPPPPPFDSFELDDRVLERKNVNERFSLGELRFDGDKFIVILGVFTGRFSFYAKNKLFLF